MSAETQKTRRTSPSSVEYRFALLRIRLPAGTARSGAQRVPAGAAGLAGKAFPAVRFEPVDERPLGHDPGRVDPVLRLVIVPLDLDEVRGVTESRMLEQVPRVTPEVAVVHQPVQIALEVDVVDGVEPGQRRVEPDVGLAELAAEQELAPGQPLLQRLQGSE